MIDTKAIRNKILDLAIRGKLTKQFPEDGTAEELYQQIQVEKQALVKSDKIKKEKNLPEIAETEIPFEIPDNWVWLRWGNLSFQIQYGYNAPAKEKGDIKMVRITDIQDNKVVWNTVPFCDIENECIDEYRLRANDILFARTGGTVGKSFLVKKVEEDAVFAGYLIRTNFSTNLNAKYMKYFMESRLYWKQLQDGTTATAQPNCNAKTLSKMIVPLPPLAEQKRIVEKIEQAFSVLDTIDELQAKYADNLTVLKSKLIDLAIRGKLTEQLPEDGTAEELYQQIQEEKQALIKSGKIKKEKPLPGIAETEIPFEIPNNWKWVRLNSICYGIFAGGDKPEDFVKEKDKEHQIPVVANGVSNEGIMGYTALATAPSNTLTVAGRGTIGFPCYRNYEYCPVVRLIVIDQSNYVNLQYLYFVFLGLPADSVGSSIPQLTVPMVMPKLIPLPPLAEQKRIVDRLDKLLAVCDGLK